MASPIHRIYFSFKRIYRTGIVLKLEEFYPEDIIYFHKWVISIRKRSKDKLISSIYIHSNVCSVQPLQWRKILSWIIIRDLITFQVLSITVRLLRHNSWKKMNIIIIVFIYDVECRSILLSIQLFSKMTSNRTLFGELFEFSNIQIPKTLRNTIQFK